MKSTTTLHSFKNYTIEYITELLNTLTHGIGLIFAIFGTEVLLQKAKGNSALFYPALVFGTSLIILYLSSTLFHGLIFTPISKYLQKLDHISIYILIAGSYTPFALIAIGGSKGIILLGSIYLICICGIIYKLFFLGRYKLLETIVYIVIGWISIVYYHPLINTLGSSGILLLILGGISYTLGTIFYGWQKLIFHHVIWHLFVIAGSLFMFLAISTKLIIS